MSVSASSAPGKIRVSVLRGGPSHEYDTSLKTGEHVLKLLREKPDRYEPKDIFISKDGAWYLNGAVKEPHQVISHSDVIFNALHGTYGEDGKLQMMLDKFGVPYTGSTSLASSVAMNKELSKKIFEDNGLNVVHHISFAKEDIDDAKLLEIFKSMLMPIVVKPASGGASLGVAVVYGLGELKQAVENAFKYGRKVLLEEYIRGKEATCGVIEKLRNKAIYALLPAEIKKNGGQIEFESIGNFTRKEKDEIERMAILAHQALGLRHYSRSDFIITPKGKVYIIETNSLPSLGENSPFSKSLPAVSWDDAKFLDHVITLALKS